VRCFVWIVLGALGACQFSPDVAVLRDESRSPWECVAFFDENVCGWDCGKAERFLRLIATTPSLVSQAAGDKLPLPLLETFASFFPPIPPSNCGSPGDTPRPPEEGDSPSSLPLLQRTAKGISYLTAYNPRPILFLVETAESQSRRSGAPMEREL